MKNIEKLEQEIEALAPPELSEFRRWFLEFDAQAWDEQIEADVTAGKLDSLAEAALTAHRRGHSRAL